MSGPTARTQTPGAGGYAATTPARRPACESCAHWTGSQCLEEPVGYAKCPRYGKDFVVKAVLPDGRLVPCKRGETPEKVRARHLGREAATPSSGGKGLPACGVKLFEL